MDVIDKIIKMLSEIDRETITDHEIVGSLRISWGDLRELKRIGLIPKKDAWASTSVMGYTTEKLIKHISHHKSRKSPLPPRLIKKISGKYHRLKKIVNETCESIPTKESIVDKSFDLRSICGVYFLIKDEKIVYVGQSVNVFSRIHQHQLTKDFDRFYYIECKESQLDNLESAFIQVYSPPLNVSQGRTVLSISR